MIANLSDTCPMLDACGGYIGHVSDKLAIIQRHVSYVKHVRWIAILLDTCANTAVEHVCLRKVRGCRC